MKKIIFILLFVHSFAFADISEWNGLSITTSTSINGGPGFSSWNGSTILASGTYVDCSGLTGDFLVHFDHASGDYYACVSAGTLNGTDSGSITVSTSYNHTSGGTQSLYATGTSQKVSYSNSGTLFDPSEGKITFWIKPTNVTSDNAIFSAYYDATHYYKTWIEGSNGKIRAYYNNGGTIQEVQSTDTVSVGTAYQIALRWKYATTVTIGAEVVGGSGDNTSSTLSLTAFTTPSTFDIGTHTSYTCEWYIDDFGISGTSGY